MKILCLFVRHGTDKYPDALPLLDQWYASHGLLEQRTLWIIDNALAPATPPQSPAPHTTLRAGDNRAWEFSAWSHAMREVAAERVEYDVVHFVTSAFNTLYTGYLGHFDPGMLRYVTGQKACLGHIDSYDQPVELAGHRSQAWIRTCFFFLPADVARQLVNWAAFTEPERIFHTADSTGFRPDAPLSLDYQQRIRVWLEGQEVGGHTWHSPIQAGTCEVERFQQKALAILNEHSLAITLRQLQIQLVDFCWLWSLRHETGPSPVPPAESAQLAIRRRILGIPSES